MKYLLALIALVAPLFAAEPVAVTAGAATYAAQPITGAASGTVTALLVFGGLGNPPAVPSDWVGKVVLVDRGPLPNETAGIPFSVKIKNALDSGAAAIIVADDIAQPLASFRIDPPGSQLTAVGVTQADGAALKLKVGTSVRIGPVVVPQPATGPVLPDPAGNFGKYLAVGPDGNYALISGAEPPTGLTFTTGATIGKPLTFAVAALGITPFSYQWTRDGKVLPGATGPTLTIASVASGDGGQYVCQVSNANGSTPSAAVIVTIK